MADLVSPANYNIIKPEGFAAYKQAIDEQKLKQQLAQAQIQQATIQSQATLAKANEFDVDKIGKIAYVKAAKGLPLDANEGAALQYITNKSNSYNPVTGVMEQKIKPPAQLGGGKQLSAPLSQLNANKILDLYEPKDEWDAKYQAQLDAAAGNPKLQQAIRQEMAKSRTTMTEAEAKAAGFADRMSLSEPMIEKNKAAGMSLAEKAKFAIPVFGNNLVSPEFQKFDQAQRDFINAQLRRESGAVISPEEFDNAKKQYFPQYGDSPEVLAQKSANRAAAMGSMRTSSGAAYTPAKPVTLSSDKDVASALMAAKKAISAGKDPNAVRQRLIDNNIDPKQAGL